MPLDRRSDQSSASVASEPIVVLSARPGAAADLRELWEFRDLFGILARRDLTIRYRQAFFGALWAALPPLATALVFAGVFSRVDLLGRSDTPYFLFAYAGLVPWQLFSSGLTAGGNSLISHQALLTKVYFPRVLLPAAALGAVVVDAILAFLMLLGLIRLYGVPINWRIMVVPVLLALTAVTSFSVALWASALNVRYRDVRHALPFLVQLWMFVTPVIYPSELVPSALRDILPLYPMWACVELFRWATINQPLPALHRIAVSSAVALLTLIGGWTYFKRMERRFADLV
jgi:lipopolysaccharide transport system permease protein